MSSSESLVCSLLRSSGGKKIEIIHQSRNKALAAAVLGIPRGSLSYKLRQPTKDELLAGQIHQVHLIHPSYGHRRVALHLKINHKRAARVMSMYGIHPPRGRRWSRGITQSTPTSYVNLIKEITPAYPSHIWTGDITEIVYRGKKLYLIELQDRYTREIVGVSVGHHHDSLLVSRALHMALDNGHVPPHYLHTDKGSENTSDYLVSELTTRGIQLSVSDTASPWQNPAESWHSRLKGEFGDPSRFETQGELIAELYAYVRYYNTLRIHTVIKMTPHQFRAKYLSQHTREQRPDEMKDKVH